ncbi:MAG: HipA N-terminal domain-containing protein [Deltaproteobacteria bacterium]|jgi:HipA-like protein|nr:HipA N-terminal domain-containing protein [Deltaproteobacteria bacterium]
MARQLTVFLFGHKEGLLQQEDGQLSFAYIPAWLSSPEARSLSQSLPLREEPFDDRAAHPFFAGLLPEGDLRIRLAKILQISRQNDFALLDGLGGECAGAVSLLEDDSETIPASTPSESPHWLNDDELTRLLENIAQTPHAGGRSRFTPVTGRRKRRPTTDSLTAQPGPQFPHPETGDSRSHWQRPQRSLLPEPGGGQSRCPSSPVFPPRFSTRETV